MSGRPGRTLPAGTITRWKRNEPHMAVAARTF